MPPKTRVKIVHCIGSALRVWYDCDKSRLTLGRLNRIWYFDVRPKREPPCRRIEELWACQSCLLYEDHRSLINGLTTFVGPSRLCSQSD